MTRRSLKFEDVCRLREARARDETGLFVAEGVRFVIRALECGAEIRALVVCRRLLRDPLGQKTAAELRARVETIEVGRQAFERLSILGEPQGIAIVCRRRWSPLPSPRGACDDLWLCIDHLRAPGNLGTMIRTALGAGARGLICLGGLGDADPFDPRAVRATMGAIFALDLVRASPAGLGRWISRTGARVIGADGGSELDYRQANYRGPAIVMLGSERKGLSDRQRHLCSSIVSIPMRDGLDSLNVSAAASVVLYQAHSQRNPLRRRGTAKARRRRPR